MARDVTPDEYRETVGLFATGVTVVTTVTDDGPHGMTVNAFASVSLEPLLVLVCVDRAAGMHELLAESEVFAVTLLSGRQEEVAEWFASSDRPPGTGQFDQVVWRPAPVSGCPVLDGGLAWLDCRVSEVQGSGDHSIFLGEVLDVGPLAGGDPLLFYAGRYHRLGRP